MFPLHIHGCSVTQNLFHGIGFSVQSIMWERRQEAWARDNETRDSCPSSNTGMFLSGKIVSNFRDSDSIFFWTGTLLMNLLNFLVSMLTSLIANFCSPSILNSLGPSDLVLFRKFSYSTPAPTTYQVPSRK